MKEFSLEQATVSITIIMTACGGLLAVLFRSKCITIRTPCITCERRINNDEPIDKVLEEPEVEP